MNARLVISCLVLEPDERTRWELSFLLQNSGITQIVAECPSLETALVRLEALRGSDRPVQVILLGFALDDSSALAPILSAIKSFAPEVAIVILGQQPISDALVKALAVEGYWWKDDRPELLLELLIKLQPKLQPKPMAIKPSIVQVSPAIAALGRLSQQSGNRVGSLDRRLSQFDQNLAQLDVLLRSGRLNRPARWIVQGRMRELMAARWIAQQVLPRSRSTASRSTASRATASRSGIQVPSSSPRSGLAKPTQLPIQSSQSQLLSQDSRRLSRLFDEFILKLDSIDRSPIEVLETKGSLPLEIDILKSEVKVQLLMLIAQVLQAEIEALRWNALSLADWNDRIPGLLTAVWHGVIDRFFRDAPEVLKDGQSVAIDQALQRSYREVAPVLDRIPLVLDWVGYGLFDLPLTIENQVYAADSDPATDRALLMLENTIFRLANAILQPFINQLSDSEAIKTQYFQRQYSTSREIAQFRNDLSWRDRRDRWWDSPSDIFESQHRILYLSSKGILEMKLYVPRQQELRQLSGLPLYVTLVLETRDALTPRVRSIVAFFGSGVVYVLTEIVGRGIGLVGQGIIKGIGNAWQERR